MMKKLIILAGLLVSLQVNAQNYAKQWCADNGDGTYTNPIINSDFPDPDIIRVGDTYYYVSTTMFYFPGATILKSHDLVNWEYCANPLQKIAESEPFNLQNGYNQYSKGQWAPSLKYYQGKFYLHFIAFNHEKFADGGDFLLTATDPEGEWKVQKLNGFYYDSGLFFDEATGRRFVVAGYNEISVTELDENFNAIGPLSGLSISQTPDWRAVTCIISVITIISMPHTVEVMTIAKPSSVPRIRSDHTRSTMDCFSKSRTSIKGDWYRRRQANGGRFSSRMQVLSGVFRISNLWYGKMDGLFSVTMALM